MPDENSLDGEKELPEEAPNCILISAKPIMTIMVAAMSAAIWNFFLDTKES